MSNSEETMRLKNAYAGKRVLITGGAGFIGSHLAEMALAAGAMVTIFDNFSTGRKENIPFSTNPGCRVVQADLCDTVLLTAACRDIDYVFHLAALADIVPSIENPVDYHRANVDGTVSLLEAARAGEVSKIVYAASSSCYGIPETFPTSEDALIAPQYPYALTKNIAEQYVLHWNRVYGLDTLALRLFNVYGPRARTAGTYGAVFGVFLAQKLAGKKMTVVGDGEQTRDFVFVTDVARAFLLAGISTQTNTVFNVGTGTPQTINKLVALLGGEVVHIPKRPGEPDSTHADISKISKCLGWQPTISFEQGVEIMLNHIDYWATAPVWTPEAIKTSTKAWFRYLSANGTGGE